MRVATATLLTACCLIGCGGGDPPKGEARNGRSFPSSDLVTTVSFPAPNQSLVTSVSSQFPADLPARVVAPPAPPPLAVATSEDPTLTLEDESGNRRTSFELEPVRGRGYPELKLTLTARRIGDAAAAAPVRPSCRDPARCEFRLARSYSVTTSDEKLVQLVPRGDGIALVARTLGVDVPKVVEIAFKVDGEVLGKKRIVLLVD